MDETNPYVNAVYRSIGSGFNVEDPEKAAPTGFRLEINNQGYLFVPRTVFEKGVVSGGTTYFFPNVLTPDFEQKIAPYAQQYTPQQIRDTLYNYSTAADPRENQFLADVEKYGYKDQQGFLLPESVAQSIFADGKLLDRGAAYGTKYGDVKFSGIQGIGTKDGQKVFVVDTSGSSGSNPTGFVDSGGMFNYSTYKEPSSFAKAANIAGWGLIALGTAGLAGVGPLAGGASAAGGGAALGTGLTAGAGGVTGLTAGAAGVTGLTAPAGFALAPALGATLGTAALGTTSSSLGSPNIFEGATFPQQGLQVPPINSSQVALIPEGTALAGQGLQVPTLPGLSAMGGGTGLAVGVPGGTVTQLGFVPTGATPVLGDPASFINNPDVLGNTVFSTDYLAAPGAAASGISASDALRLANQAAGLLGAGQNPLVPQGGTGGLPGRAAGQVDYSGLLALLQRQATTPGISSLLAPAQLAPIYRPLLTQDTLSLLG